MTIRIDPDGVRWDDVQVRFFDLGGHVYDRVVGTEYDKPSFTAWAAANAYTLNASNFGAPPAGSSPPYGVEDFVAPLLTVHTLAAAGPTSLSGSITTDSADGVITSIITRNGTKPTVDQLLQGLDNLGNPAAAMQTIVVTSAGAKALSATGLTAVSYYSHAVHTDGHGNVSLISTSSQATPALAREGAKKEGSAG